MACVANRRHLNDVAMTSGIRAWRDSGQPLPGDVIVIGEVADSDRA